VVDPFLVRKPKILVIVYDSFGSDVYELLLNFEENWKLAAKKHKLESIGCS